MSTPPQPGPDVSVRVAWADDADAVGALQVAAWQERYAGLLPASVRPSAEQAAEAWRTALGRPGDARNRVLVALERNRVTGFVVTTPAGDPDCDPVADGEVRDLTVAAGETSAGHGSRLMQAAIDTLRADRFSRAVTWVLAADDALRAFLVGAGWAPDGAHRELALADSLDEPAQETGTDGPQGGVKQIRLHTAL